jgi:benzoyl-CoA reductase/2-hydroxyglutaryl-CoA dehydratase subunit BcrC/BadD/HgdB
LHIREYDDKYLVHTDRADPRKNPLAHLVLDAPEVLVGLAAAVIGGGKVASYMKKNNKSSVIPGVLASLVIGYLGFSLTRKIKDLQ